MNVLFLAADVDLRVSRGDSVHVRELAQHLAQLGHSITLSTATPGEVNVSDVRHILCPSSLVSQIQMLKPIAHRWADVIYERRFSPKLSWSLGLLTDRPFVMEVNGVLHEEREAQGQGAVPANSMVRRRLRRFMLRHASRIVAVSEGIRDHLIHEHGIADQRVIVVQNGANTVTFHPLDRAMCRRELSISPNSKVLCFVGNLVAWQGVDALLRSLLTLSHSETGILLLVVGDGPELSRLQVLASEIGVSRNVRFVGSVPHDDVPRYIGAADICVAPLSSSRKASPIKVFEYLACARPVVATSVEEVGDLLRRSQGGLVLDRVDEASLVAAIGALLRNPEEAEQMGFRGRDAVARDHSWNSTANRVAEVLEIAISGRRGNNPRRDRRRLAGTRFSS